MNRKNIKLFLIPAILFTVFLGFGNEARAATDYYVSPSGSGTTCSNTSPCTLATGLGKSLVRDDNLILKDGTYTGTSLTVPWSGTAGHPITIKAENDGQAIIDGQGVRVPCDISGTLENHKHDIDIEGIVCKNSSLHAFNISYTDRLILRRVSAYDAGTGGSNNNHVFSVYISSNVLFEDCVATGYGRVLWNIYQTTNATLRRCWGRWTNYTGSYGTGYIVQIYGSDNCIVENCVGTITPSGGDAGGVAIWANTYNDSADNNKIYGNVMRNFNPQYSYIVSSANHNIIGNIFLDNVSLDSLYGFLDWADSNLTVNHLTIYNSSIHYTVGKHPYTPKDGDFAINANLKNSSFLTGSTGMYISSSTYLGTFSHTYNNLYGITNKWGTGTSQDPTEKTLNPNYDTATYGKGAYLMVPSALQGKGKNGADIGAEVLYRYQDGVLTNTPLWPWPMEDRIKNETGYSVTYESDSGIWKTLDGVYSDTIPPASPTGLTVL